MADRAELGHAEALDDLAAEPRPGLRGELGAERRCTGEDLADRRHVEVVDDRCVGETEDDRRHGEEPGDLQLLHRGERLDHVEAGHRDRGDAVGEQTVHQDLHAVDVEERQRGERDFVVAVLEGVAALLDVGDQVAMREHHTLGEPGRAGRVRQHHGVRGRVDRDLLDRIAEHVGHRRRARAGVADHDHLGDVGALDRRERGLDEHADREQHRRAGVLQLVADLLGSVGRVDRGDRAAGDGHAVEDDGVLGHVRRHQPDDDPRGDATSGEPAGQRVNGRAQLGVRVRARARSVTDGNAVGELVGQMEDVCGDRDVGDLDVGQRAGMDDHGDGPSDRGAQRQ